MSQSSWGEQKQENTEQGQVAGAVGRAGGRLFMASQGFRELRVYQLAFRFAMEIFHLSKSFPPEEKYSLMDQIRRASRSVAANIAEGYRKKQYPKVFVSKMADADGEATETQVWLAFARQCGYLSAEKETLLIAGYEEVGRMLGGMIAHPERFSR